MVRRVMGVAAAGSPYGWLLMVLFVDVAVGSVARVASLGRVLGGGRGWTDLVGSAGLLLLPAIVVLTLRAMREVRALAQRAEQDRGDLQALAASSHEWFWRADADFRLTSVNRAVSAIVGYQPEQLLGRSLFDFLHPDDLTRARAIVDAARLHAGGWTDAELRWQHRDGSTVRLQGSGNAVTDATGAVVGFRGARRPCPAPAKRADAAAARRRSRKC